MQINTIILKIASRCNINCTYCYMYNHGDDSYKKLPKFFSQENVLHLAERIKNNCQKTDTNYFSIIFHGGEPLLYPKHMYEFFFETMAKLKEEHGITVRYAMQTNGIMLNPEICEILNKYNVGIGISLDGEKSVNDLNRLDMKGLGTYDSVVKGVEIGKKHLKHALGSLSVVNVKTDPVNTYNTFRDLGFKAVDFLMLDENHDTIGNIEDVIENEMNANWMIRLFDYWYSLPNSERINLRKFETIMSYILGNGRPLDAIGAGKNQLMVVETDGGYEPVDVLKICGDSFTKLKLQVANNEIDEIFESSLVEVYYNSGSYLSRKCLACPVKEICGGGYLPHRYSSKNGFNNPSIYCRDLMRLIIHIQNKVIDSMPEDLIEESGIEKLTVKRALEIIEENLQNTPEPEYAELLESFSKNEYAY